FPNRLKRLLQFVLHAAAGIDKDADADRHAEIVRKKRKLLFLPVLEDFEIVSFEAVHVFAAFVEHRGHDVYERYIDSEFVLLVVCVGIRIRGCIRVRRRLRRRWRLLRLLRWLRLLSRSLGSWGLSWRWRRALPSECQHSA